MILSIVLFQFVDLISKEFVDLYTTLLWILFWSVLLIAFRKQLAVLIGTISTKVKDGASVELFGIKFGASPPKSLSNDPGTVAVSDKHASKPETSTVASLDKRYELLKSDRFYLLHASEVLSARTKPYSGLYRIRVWVESLEGPINKDSGILKVTYRLWDDFGEPVISTASAESNFDIWLTVY